MTQRKSIAWILNFTSKLPNEEEQIKCLRANDGVAIRTILQFCFDPRIRWLLPEGDAPYDPPAIANDASGLYAEARKLYLFVGGGNDNLPQLKRERLFLDLLQSVTPDDANLLISIKDKKFPYEGLTVETILKAFPGLY
jgi:hypothetical protein